MFWKRKEKSRITLLIDSMERDFRTGNYDERDGGGSVHFLTSGAYVLDLKRNSVCHNGYLGYVYLDRMSCHDISEGLTKREFGRIYRLVALIKRKCRADLKRECHDKRMELRCLADDHLEKKGFK